MNVHFCMMLTLYYGLNYGEIQQLRKEFYACEYSRTNCVNSVKVASIFIISE